MKGGLGAVNIVGSMFFGAISGSSVADTATFSTLLVPRMKEEGYPEGYAAAITVTSATLSTIKPPSIQIVLAAAATNQSIGAALAAGIIPGTIVGLFLLIPNYILSKKHKYGKKHPFSFSNLVVKFKESWTAQLAPWIILGSIFSGLVTPTEGAGVTVLYILLVDGVLYRKLGLKEIWSCLKKTASLTSAILLIASGSAVMNFVIAYENVPQAITNFLVSVPGGKFGFGVVIIIILILIGMVIDATPATLIFTPLFLPAAVSMGFDPTQFIIMMIMGVALGMVTPTYGICLFTVSTITGIPVMRVINAAWPFYCMILLAMVLVATIPGITLILPRLLGMLN
jgi:tripartite ATP-independent transporter DctM subunit